MNRPEAQIEFAQEFSERLTVHKNIDQEVVVTTVDKVRLCLIENRDCLAAKGQWLTPLALLIAIVTTLLTADFRADVLLPAETWQAIYVLSALGTFAWLCRALYRVWQNRTHGGIDEVVARLKATSVGGVG